MENTFPTLEAVWTPPALHSGLLFTAAATGVQSTLWKELFLDSEPASEVDGWLRDCEAVLIMNKISPFLDQTFKNVAKSQDTSFDLTGSCAEGLFCFVLSCFFLSPRGSFRSLLEEWMFLYLPKAEDLALSGAVI